MVETFWVHTMSHQWAFSHRESGKRLATVLDYTANGGEGWWFTTPQGPGGGPFKTRHEAMDAAEAYVVEEELARG